MRVRGSETKKREMVRKRDMKENGKVKERWKERENDKVKDGEIVRGRKKTFRRIKWQQMSKRMVGKKKENV